MPDDDDHGTEHTLVAGIAVRRDPRAKNAALQRRLAAAIKLIRGQYTMIAELNSRIDRMLVRIADGERPDRRISAAVVFMDVEGWSKVEGPKKKAVAALLWGAAKSVLRDNEEDLILANTWGDALMAAFRSPNAALRCVFAFQRHLELEHYASRAGVAWGPIDLQYNHVRDAMDVIAATVDYAARLEPLVKAAGPYSVLASAEVGDHPEVDRREFHFEPMNLPLEKDVGDKHKGTLLRCYGVRTLEN